MAQNTGGKISGFVTEQGGKAIESGSITLLRGTDSSRIRTIAADKTGRFSFEEVQPGKYLLTATAVGHLPVYSTTFELTTAHPSYTVPTLSLVRGSQDLQAVSVVATKPFIEQKADRMVINVEASPTNSGLNAMEVLEKTPGVTIDKDDNISLKGKAGVTIMVDNKPTYMSSAQLASYLKGLPASALDQIEVMTNPSAKYDAAGNSGIINIKTKKNKAQGFNGSAGFTYNQGVYAKPTGNINLNYRNGKANFFLNGGYSYWQGYQELDITRKYLDPNTEAVNSIFSQATTMRFANPSANLKVGMDYYLTPKTTLGFVASGFYNTENHYSTSHILLEDPNQAVDSIVISPSTVKTSWKNVSLNLNFRHQFDSTGRELTADLDLVRYGSGSEQNFINSTFNPDMSPKGEPTVLLGHLPADINIYSFKSDYTLPFGKTIKFEAGIKASYVNTDNTADYFNVINKIEETDTTKTNHFLYRENINAAYVNLNKQWKKWSLQAGLRAENTNYSGHQLGNGSTVSQDSSFSRSYVSLFPTFYISYQASKNHQFTLNYGRRIDRPAYQDLNPFLFFLDQFTYQAGNPYLQPQFSQNMEFSHTYKSFLTTTLNYSYTEDFFSETFEQSGRATIVRRGNIGSRQSAGIAVSAHMPIVKGWMVMIYSNLNYNRFKGMLYGEPLDVSAATLLLNMNNQFTFGHGWGGELSGWYRSEGIEGQMVLDPMGAASAALTKKLLNEKATVKLGLSDIFHTNHARGHIDFQQTQASFTNVRDSRMVSLTLNYRFGKPLKGAPVRSRSGSGDEQNRVKVGGN
jgi:hypothetical protein